MELIAIKKSNSTKKINTVESSRPQKANLGEKNTSYDVHIVKIGPPVFGRPFVKRFALCFRLSCLSCLSCSVCLSLLSVCDVGVLWPNGWMNQEETWHAGRPRPGYIVLDGDPAPLPEGTQSPQFSAHICCGQMAA